MHRSSAFQHTLPSIVPRTPGRPSLDPFDLGNWTRPTFGEFVRQIEHEFGDSVDLSSLHLIRADRDERLTPNSVRRLCELIGIPPEDFGV